MAGVQRAGQRASGGAAGAGRAAVGNLKPRHRGRGAAAGRRRRPRAAEAGTEIETSAADAVARPAELLALEGASVLPCSETTGNGQSSAVPLDRLWSQAAGERHVLVFLSHFGDLTSWEYAQKLRDNMNVLEARGGGVSVVGLGTPANGRKFAELLDFPLMHLYACPDLAVYKALGFAPGFLPDAAVSPYLKLLGMLAGAGSPGTIQEVVRGYVGDRDARQIFESSPFDVLGTGYQRPFELATLRLSNMVGLGALAPEGAAASGCLPNWAELVSDEALICQQGGTLAFEGARLLHAQRDSGILKYADVELLLEALGGAEGAEAAAA